MDNYLIAIVAASLVFLGLGYLLGNRRVSALMIELSEAKQKTELELANLKRANDDLKESNDELVQTKEALSLANTAASSFEKDTIKLNTDLGHLQKENSRLSDEVERLTILSEEQATQIGDLTASNAGLISELKAEKDKVLAGELNEEKLETLTNKILVNNVTKLNEESAKKLEGIVAPINVQFKNLGEAVTKSTEEFSKNSALSLQHIGMVAGETVSLVDALRGKNQTQGKWGENGLQRVLELSGLIKDIDFKLQGTSMGFRDENGRSKRPDVVVYLPDDKHIVIDAKVSIVPYERWVNEQDPEQKAKYLKGFIESVQAHIEGLGSKDYCDLEGLNLQCPVILYLNSDEMLNVYTENDSTYSELLQRCRVRLAGPQVLSIMLGNVNAFLKVEKQNKNTLDIANLASGLYDNFVNILTMLYEMQEQQKGALDYNSRIISEITAENHQSIITRCNKMKILGVKGKETKERAKAKKKFRDLKIHLDGESDEDSAEVSEASVLTDETSGMEPVTLN